MTIWRHAPTSLRMPANQAPPLTLNIDYQRWMADALCAQVEGNLFFPDKGGSTRDAKAVCSACPVRGPCLDYALDHDETYGIWGGTSERERRRLRRGTRKTCGACGQPFVPRTWQTLYCSDGCRRLAHRRQDEESRRRKRRRAAS